jgi:hypothetical protein
MRLLASLPQQAALMVWLGRLLRMGCLPACLVWAVISDNSSCCLVACLFACRFLA